MLFRSVRIKSILNKYKEQGGQMEQLELLEADNEAEKAMEMVLVQFNTMVRNAAEETAPQRVCAYVYDLANAFNHFYHNVKILGEACENKRKSLIALLILTRDIMETCIDLLGFSAPEKM